MTNRLKLHECDGCHQDTGTIDCGVLLLCQDCFDGFPPKRLEPVRHTTFVRDIFIPWEDFK